MWSKHTPTTDMWHRNGLHDGIWWEVHESGNQHTNFVSPKFHKDTFPIGSRIRITILINSTLIIILSIPFNFHQSGRASETLLLIHNEKNCQKKNLLQIRILRVLKDQHNIFQKLYYIISYITTVVIYYIIIPFLCYKTISDEGL